MDELVAAAAVFAMEVSSDDEEDTEVSDTMETNGSTDPAADVSAANKENLNVDRQPQTVRS